MTRSAPDVEESLTSGDASPVARKTSPSEIQRSHIWDHTLVTALLLAREVFSAVLLWILDRVAPQYSWLIGWLHELVLWFIVLTFAQFALCGLLVIGIYNVMTVVAVRRVLLRLLAFELLLNS